MAEPKMKYMVTLPPDFLNFRAEIKKSATLLEQLRVTAEEAFQTEQAEKYAEEVKKTAQSVSGSVGSMKRALAGFDQINRMNRLKNTGTAKSKEQLLLEYLNSVDFESTIARLHLARNAIGLCGQAMDEAVEKLLTVELHLSRNTAQWQAMELSMETAMSRLQRLMAINSQYLSQNNQLSLSLTGVKTAASALQLTLEKLTAQEDTAGLKCASLATKCTTLHTAALQLSTTLSVLRMRLAGLFDEQVQGSITSGAEAADTAVHRCLSGMQVYLQSGFLPQWNQAWRQIASTVTTQMQAMPDGVKLGLNQTISLFNSFLEKLTAGFNSYIQSANQLQLKVGQLTGTQVTRLPMMSVPKIPMLAQGAVLPANKPFMAVVGDQKHGTNVEAPLAVIQEAVAAVMQESISANMAGHEATVAVLREILQAVLGISIGDDVIAAAVQRYRTRMAVVTGGAL